MQPFRLQYAANRRRTHRWLRRGVVALVLLGMCAGAICFRKPIWAHARLLYWQRQCMNYTEAPGHVAFMRLAKAAPATKKDEFAALTGSADYVVARSKGAEFQPRCVAKFRDLSNLGPGGVFAPSAGCLYAHRCRSPGAHDRLVRVDIDGGDGGDSFGWEEWSLSGMVIRPASVFSKPVVASTRGKRLNMSYDGELYVSSYFQFFTGRPDPVDPSHFTIDYEVGICPRRRAVSDPVVAPVAVRGTIDGWLRDDDTVVFSPRGGKLTDNRTWWSLNDPLESPGTTPVGH